METLLINHFFGNSRTSVVHSRFHIAYSIANVRRVLHNLMNLLSVLCMVRMQTVACEEPRNAAELGLDDLL